MRIAPGGGLRRGGTRGTVGAVDAEPVHHRRAQRGGKTTYARRFLGEELRLLEFLNVDMMAASLSPFAPEQAALPAGRWMLQRLRELAVRHASFAFETTLSGRSYVPLLADLRTRGYTVRLDFLWVPSLEMARERIRQRVAKGGHVVSEEVQARRFTRGVKNLVRMYRPLLDHWRLLDNSGDSPRLIAEETGGVLRVADADTLAAVERLADTAILPAARPDRVAEPGAMTPEEETRCAVRAIRKAFADAVIDNHRHGLPVLQWRGGQVVAVPAEELLPLARRILAANGEAAPEG